MFDIPDWSLVKNPFYNLKGTDKNRLLITVGDSWTYGDSLGKTKVRNGIDDTDYRLSHVYGHVMSQSLECDWINLALPGVSNFCMLNWLAKLLLSKTDHTRIDCVITLTESGRHEELYYLNPNLLLQKNLENIVYKSYQWINELKLRNPKVNFIVGHNFTDSMPETNGMLCSRSWLEVMLDKKIQNGTFVVVSEHIEQMNYSYQYPDRLDILDKALTRIDSMDDCDFCNKEDSRHPNENGHRLWAHYLLNQL